jgi:Protein of unknown function (DUF3108)
MEGPFNDPEIPNGERTAYRGLVGGEEAGGGEVVVERASDDGRDLYRQSVSARVAGRAELRSETTFRRRSGTMHAEAHETRTLDGDGPPVAVEQARFRDVKVLHWGAELEPYPRDVTPLLGCAVALRGLEFEKGARRSFSVWVVSSIYWGVETKVEKREEIELPAGSLDAWRVRVRPSFEQVDKALDSVMDAVMPPVVAHFEADPPHRLLRLEFPTGPFKWNPPGLIEATEL